MPINGSEKTLEELAIDHSMIIHAMLDIPIRQHGQTLIDDWEDMDPELRKNAIHLFERRAAAAIIKEILTSYEDDPLSIQIIGVLDDDAEQLITKFGYRCVGEIS